MLEEISSAGESAGKAVARPSFLSELIRRFGRRTNRPGGLVKLAEGLISERGEASGVALATELLEGYGALKPDEKLQFLEMLSQQFGAETDRLNRAIADYQADPGAEAAAALHAAAEPRRQELIRRLNLAPGGTARLVSMRQDVLANLHRSPRLGPLDGDFVHLFSSWFNRGFLVLRRIDWSTPADILEKIIRYEAVHEISSWDDLRRRIQPSDRRCFAFFHPALDDEPLIFVEVALTDGVPGAIGPLLTEPERAFDPRRASTAAFYSISNCQEGLKGVSFGNFLIKQVVEELKHDLPSLKTFVTLSPVPGFMRWLNVERANADSQHLSKEERLALGALDSATWQQDAAAAARLRPVLLTALARYFFVARTPNGRMVDPVARFHLGNGARLQQFDWLADPSPKGLAQSAGMMVNYLYDLGHIEQNHEDFVKRGEIAASSSLRRLLRNGQTNKHSTKPR
jgi:malonyl-CoA decarboxylase